MSIEPTTTIVSSTSCASSGMRDRRRDAVDRQIAGGLDGRRGARSFTASPRSIGWVRTNVAVGNVVGLQRILDLVVAPAVVGRDRRHVGLDRRRRQRRAVERDRAGDGRGAPDRRRRADAGELLLDAEADERAGGVLEAELADRRVDGPRTADVGRRRAAAGGGGRRRAPLGVRLACGRRPRAGASSVAEPPGRRPPAAPSEARRPADAPATSEPPTTPARRDGAGYGPGVGWRIGRAWWLMAASLADEAVG